MITPEHEYYIRFILLLLQAGTDLLREIIKKALHKRNETLHQFLNSFQPAILNDKALSQIQKDTLYPQNAQGASIGDFDITLLSHLINNYLNNDIVQLEMNATNDIRQWRNKYNAHTTEAKMDTKTFTKEWSKLVRIITKVDNGMSSEVGERHGAIIDSFENDSIDIMVLVQEIKKLDMTRVFFENIEHLNKIVQEDLKEINKSQKDITKNQYEIKEGQELLTGKVDSLKIIVQSTADTVAIASTDIKELRAELLTMKKKEEEREKVLEKHEKLLENQATHIDTILNILAETKLSPDDQKTKDEVTACLNKACKNFNANVPPTNAVEENLFNLCTDYETLGVTVESVSSGSIIFKFKCLTLTSLLELIDYFYSPDLQKHLDEIAEALADMMGKPISIKALGIDEQSLREAITDLKKKEYETVLQLKLCCRGIDGLLHVLEVFEEGKAAKSLNEISEALSEAVGKPITLHASIDVARMKTAIQKIKDQLAAADSQNPSVRINVSNLGSQKPSVSKTHQQLKSQDYHEVLTKMDSAGALHKEHHSRNLGEQASASSVYKPTHVVKDIKLKYKANNITGCALLTPESDKLILADKGSKELVVLDIQTGPLMKRKLQTHIPFDIAVLPNNQAAVTFPLEDEITIINTTNTSTIRSITVKTYPSGITYYNGKLYVIHHQSTFNRTFYSVLVLNRQGDHLREIQLDIRYSQSYIAVSKDEESMYITSQDDQGLIKYSLHGKRIAKKWLPGPRGIAILDDGSLLVCCTGAIHHISADLKQDHTLIWNAPNANSICYDRDNHSVYVCSDIIRVFRFTRDELDEIILKDQDRIHKGAQLRSDSDYGRNTKPNLKVHPETTTQEELGGNKLTIKSSSEKQISKPYLKVHPETTTQEAVGGIDLSIKSSSHKHISNDVSLIYKKDIHLKDNDTIISCAVLSPNSILVADGSLYTLTVVDTDTGSVVAKTKMYKKPCGIAVLPDNQAAVKFYHDNMILILSTKDLSTILRIPINDYPSGMTSHEHELYVICKSYKSDLVYIRVVGLNGENLREIPLHMNEMNISSFHHDNDIVVSKDKQSLYITNRYKNTVIRYSLQGLSIGEYKHQETDVICGLTVLDDGSLLVCYVAGAIHHISADLKQGHILTSVASGINSMGYDVDNNLVYISSWCNIIQVFSLEKSTDNDCLLL